MLTSGPKDNYRHNVPIAETTQSEHHRGDHRYGIKQAAGYARIVPSPTTTASPPT